jgi:hypothetical protein
VLITATTMEVLFSFVENEFWAVRVEVFEFLIQTRASISTGSCPLTNKPSIVLDGTQCLVCYEAAEDLDPTLQPPISCHPIGLQQRGLDNLPEHPNFSTSRAPWLRCNDLADSMDST